MVGVVYAVLRDDLKVTSAYLLLVVMVVLLVPGFYAHLRGHYRLSRFIALLTVSLATGAVGMSIVLLVALVPIRVSPLTVAHDAGLIWVANVLRSPSGLGRSTIAAREDAQEMPIEARVYSFPRTKTALLAGLRTSRITCSLPSTRVLPSVLQTPRSWVSGQRSCL